MKKKEKKLTRKDFIKKTYTGLTGLFAYNLLKMSSPEKANSPGKMSGFRILGRTGIRVTNIGFGASRTMEPALLIHAIDKGINFVDTGRGYFNGNNEIMVGNALKGIRKNMVLQSKMKIPSNQQTQTVKFSNSIRNIMESSLYASLKALQTDYIDIMLIHGASTVSDISNDTVMEFLSKAKKKGYIKAFGFSFHNEIEVLKYANEIKFYDIIMLPYNHKGSYIHMNSGRYREWDQPGIEIELKKAHKNNLGIVAMKTCSAGPYSSKQEENPSYRKALQWVISHEFISSMAVAMSNFSQIDENVQVLKG